MRTLVRQVALLAVVSVAVFLLMKASPVDPVDAYLGPAMAHVGPDQRAQIAASWGWTGRCMNSFWLGRGMC